MPCLCTTFNQWRHNLPWRTPDGSLQDRGIERNSLQAVIVAGFPCHHPASNHNYSIISGNYTTVWLQTGKHSRAQPQPCNAAANSKFNICSSSDQMHYLHIATLYFIAIFKRHWLDKDHSVSWFSLRYILDFVVWQSVESVFKTYYYRQLCVYFGKPGWILQTNCR